MRFFDDSDEMGEEIVEASDTGGAFINEHKQLSGDGTARVQKRRLVADAARKMYCTVGDLVPLLKECL